MCYILSHISPFRRVYRQSSLWLTGYFPIRSRHSFFNIILPNCIISTVFIRETHKRIKPPRLLIRRNGCAFDYNNLNRRFTAYYSAVKPWLSRISRYSTLSSASHSSFSEEITSPVFISNLYSNLTSFGIMAHSSYTILPSSYSIPSL